MHQLKGAFGYAMLAVCVALAYQGYRNARHVESTEALAKRVVCEADSRCMLTEERPREMSSDMFGRHYRWRTTVGKVEVTCRRRLVFAGDWSCHVVL